MRDPLWLVSLGQFGKRRMGSTTLELRKPWLVYLQDNSSRFGIDVEERRGWCFRIEEALFDVYFDSSGFEIWLVSELVDS